MNQWLPSAYSKLLSRSCSLIIGILVLTPSTHGQLSVSGGLSRLIEGPFIGFPGYYQNEDNKLGVYDFFAVGIEKTKGVFGTWGAVSYLPASRSLEQVEYSHSGGGSSPFYSSYKVYKSRVNFSYVGLKGGIGLVAGEYDKSKKMNFIMTTGAYLKLEFLSSYKETDQELYCREGNDNNQWGTLDYSDCSVENPDFDSLNKAYVLQQLGLEVKFRISYQKFFTELMISAGRYPFSERTTLLLDYRRTNEPTERPYYAKTFGIRFGWYLEKVKDGAN